MFTRFLYTIFILIQDDSENLLKDMGVNIIEDASNDSMDLPLPAKRFQTNGVLKTKDQNARTCQQTTEQVFIRFNSSSVRTTVKRVKCLNKRKAYLPIYLKHSAIKIGPLFIVASSPAESLLCYSNVFLKG